MKSNCLIFALCRWWSGGGYLLVRRSRHSWWPHFLWADSIEGIPLRHFTPIQPRKGWRLLFHPLWFKGYIKGCDRDRCVIGLKRQECKFCLDKDDES